MGMAMLLQEPDNGQGARRASHPTSGPTKNFAEDSDPSKLPYLTPWSRRRCDRTAAAPLLLARGGGSTAAFAEPGSPCHATNVLVNLWAMGRDPAGRVRAGRRPFGAGQRMCPGMDFGLRGWCRCLLASLPSQDAWRPADGFF
ncbi:hypothetical protein PR202_gb24594 [Eleusine coracana subsp. coracana]|uniref:Uncharacterized protein n=1 Tax=Eleusine coracana subsp. coracana TaxID=191504 RepID=A0AAV5FME7_ELECO|nr:hypothetical protein PR202_gb24594 [Eleusine coracana subsp. coracana]